MEESNWAGRQLHQRLFVAAVFFFTCILAFGAILWHLQVVKGADYLAQSTRKIAKLEAVEAARGKILDRNGNVLVSNRVSWQVKIEPAEMGKDRDKTILTLIRLCREKGIRWTDTLPISQNPPYQFFWERVSEAEKVRYEKLADLMEWGKSDTGSEVLAKIAESFGISAEYSLQEKRLLAGVLYEAALRSEEVTRSEYIFAPEVDPEWIVRVKELDLPGVSVTAVAARQYKTTVAAHILGRVGKMDESEWKYYQPVGYGMDDTIGKDGVEQAFEQYLHGSKGKLALETDSKGSTAGETWITMPQPGDDLELTVDLGLQEKTEEALASVVSKQKGAEGAAAVILDVTDGGVLAMASYPTYDLSTFSADYGGISSDPLRPMFNRSLQGAYPPGSTFKMVTAIGALEEGVITPETKILDTGIYRYYKSPRPKCWIYRQYHRTHGLETVSKAITDSCNIFFYDTGRRLGIDRLEDYARRFGLGQKTGIELTGEEAGSIAGPEYSEANGQTWYEGSILSAAIGQENNRVTPLQLANYLSTLVNGGNHWQVHLFNRVLDHSTGRVLKTYEKTLLSTVEMQPENLNAVKEGMRNVTENGSVSRYFRRLPVTAGAKTGSAQVAGSENSNAVFVCFAPYDQPKIAIAIVVEKGGSGSELGSVAADILNYYFAVRE